MEYHSPQRYSNPQNVDVEKLKTLRNYRENIMFFSSRKAVLEVKEQVVHIFLGWNPNDSVVKCLFSWVKYGQMMSDATLRMI